jgi:periplasmic protein TonB
MGAALPVRPSALHGIRLPSWIMLSVLTHLLVLSTGRSGTALITAPHRHPLMTVNIRYITPETPAPVTISGSQPEIESLGAVVALTQQTLLEETKSKASASSTVAERPFPFDTYFSIGDLDVKSEPLNEVLLRYPWVEYQQRLGGVVRFTLYINAHGGLDKIELIDATPPGHFEDAAWDAVKKLQFAPARKNGRPVKSQKTIDVVFDPNEDFTKPVAKQPNSSVAEK